MKKNGFAIIELLVVIGIISVITTVAISSAPTMKLRWSLLRQVNKFAQDARIAQQMALSGMSYKDALGVEREIDGYGIYVDTIGLGKKKYIMYADKKPGNKQFDAGDYVIETIDFSVEEPGIIIKEVQKTSLNNVSINFGFSKVETTITQLNVGENNVEVIFSAENNLTIIKKASINASGLIEVK